MRISKFLPLVGIAIFIYVLSTIDLSRLVADFQSINLGIYLISLVIAFGMIPLKALKWKYLIKTYNIDFPLWKASKAWLVGFGIGQITPGRVGDFARAYYLRNDTKIGKSLTTVLIDRVIDVGILIVLAILGLYMFITYYVNNLFLLPVLAFISIAFVVFLFLLTKENLVRKILRPFYKRFFPKKFKESGAGLFSDFFLGIRDMKSSKKNITLSIILGLLLWFLSIVQMYVIGLSLNLNITLFFMAIAVPITILLETLPISFSGVGVRDISLIYFFGYLSIASASAVSVGLLLLVSNYLVTLLGLLFWLKDPIKLDQIIKSS